MTTPQRSTPLSPEGRGETLRGAHERTSEIETTPEVFSHPTHLTTSGPTAGGLFRLEHHREVLEMELRPAGAGVAEELLEQVVDQGAIDAVEVVLAVAAV